MRPRQPEAEPREDLFRARPQNPVDARHAPVRLAGLIDRGRLEAEFGVLYTDGGRPGLPTRLMVGPHLLKHMDGPSDEAVCGRCLDGPYARLFCGETHFRHAPPLDRSSMTRRRRRIGPERLEVPLAESLMAARRSGAVEERHPRRVTTDTTAQPRAVTRPTDGRLPRRGIEIPARLARRRGVRLRRSHLRVAERARREAAELIHSGRRRQAERHVRQPRTRPGRLACSATSAARPRATPTRATPTRATPKRGPPPPVRSGSSPGRRGGGARTAAGTSSTPCTPPRWGASAGARRTPATGSA